MGVLIGFIIGFIVATTGFTGLAAALDNGISNVKNVSVKIEDKK